MLEKIERHLVFILGIWQIFDGGITILINEFSDTSVISERYFRDYPSKFFVIFGMVLIISGITNILVSKFYIKSYKQTQPKILIWILVQCIFSCMIFDFLGIMCSSIAMVFLIARNKTLKKIIKEEE